MKKRIIGALLIAANLFMNNTSFANRDREFDTYKESFVQALWKMYPVWASSVGFHRYDDLLPVPDAAERAAELGFCKNQLYALKKFRLEDLSDANKTDYYLIKNQLESTEWSINTLKAHEWDPSTYNVSGTFADMLNNKYAPADERLRNFSKRLDNVPAYYAAAKKNIANPTKEHTDLAIEQMTGGLSVFEADLDDALKNSALTAAEKKEISNKAQKSVAAIKDYVEWLKKLPNPNPRSFRLGADLYKQKFAFDLQSRYTADEIYAKAVAHKEELHNKMYALTRKLWPKYMGNQAMPADKLTAIKQMIDTLSVNHTTKNEFQATIEKQIPQLVAFVKSKDLIYLDPSKPLVVRKEPAYMAGVAGASINSPGPYDKNGNTYYNVGSLENWDDARAESYLREYNHYILPILNIHEAIPGHYTQLIYANQSPSIIKSILGNNAMIEGWAVYSELMMLENGYDVDQKNAAEASPEMWLMYYKWNLRSTCNTILDYSVHTKNMSKEDAMKLLVNEAFQQQAEAEGKWKRVSVTQVQLCCYFTGYSEIYALREEMKAMDKKNFNLKKFHEKFLSYGSAPVKYIRELMMASRI